MKREKLITKAVNSKHSKNIRGMMTVQVKNHVAIVQNTEMYVEFPTNLSDGNYDKSFLEKGLVQITKDEFEKFNFPDDFSTFSQISPSVIEEIITAKSFIGKDEFRPALCGVFVTNTEIAATDAHRLYFNELATGFNRENIIPIDVINLLKVANSSIKVYEDSENSEYVKFECEEFTAVCRMISDKFPNWRAVVPDSLPITVSVDRKELLASLRKLIHYANQHTKLVKFVFDHKKLTLIAEDNDLDYSLTEELPTSGSNVKTIFVIGFNCRYLIDSIRFLDSSDDKVKFGMSKPSSAGILNNKILLMPVMMQS